MHKTAQKMIRSAMLAFLEGKTNLKDDIMDFEESMHMLQNKSINIIATQMAENSFDEKNVLIISCIYLGLLKPLKG